MSTTQPGTSPSTTGSTSNLPGQTYANAPAGNGGANLKHAQSALASTAQQTREKVSEHLGAVREDLREGYSQAREDLREVGDVAHVYAERAGEAVQRGWQQTKLRTRQYTEQGGEMVRQHPIAALAIAVGAGYLLARLIGSRR